MCVFYTLAGILIFVSAAKRREAKRRAARRPPVALDLPSIEEGEVDAEEEDDGDQEDDDEDDEEDEGDGDLRIFRLRGESPFHVPLPPRACLPPRASLRLTCPPPPSSPYLGASFSRCRDLRQEEVSPISNL